MKSKVVKLFLMLGAITLSIIFLLGAFHLKVFKGMNVNIKQLMMRAILFVLFVKEKKMVIIYL